MRYLKFFMLMFMLLPLGQIHAQDSVIAPNIFIRGLHLSNGVRYSAAFIKPTDDTLLRNVSVEITLPPSASLLEMFVPEQVEFDVVRVNQQGALTLIWQISRISAESPVDAFSFSLSEPLTSDLEFYMHWQDENGQQLVENFLELPAVTVATQTEGQVVPLNTFTYAEQTGVQVAVAGQNAPFFLSVRLLASNVNPPPEYGDIWWCSILEILGLPEGLQAEVIVPLRRPIAPFTVLQLFQQQADGSWSAIAGQAIVTADGQYVMYTHPGGIVATGGDSEIQPEITPIEDIQIVEWETPPQEVAQNPEDTGITDGTSNTIIIGEIQPTENAEQPEILPTLPEIVPTTITDGSSNTITIGEEQPPVQENLPTLVPTISSITDGSSNTIVIGEVTPTANPSTITDGSSNTIVIGEVTPTANPSTITDGDITPTPTTVTIPTIEVSIQPFGGGGTRVQINILSGNLVQQCQVGGVNCATLHRRRGSRA